MSLSESKEADINILLTYLYRDAGNYKQWGEVVFANADGTDPAALEANARGYLIDRHWFVAKDLGVPDLRSDEWDDELDHDWHELHSLTETEDEADDGQCRDIGDFLRTLRAMSYASSL